MRPISSTLLLAVCAILCATVAVGRGEPVRLNPAPSPPDNPLRGLVPYTQMDHSLFPHSLEFGYIPLASLMTGPDTFDWAPLETLLTSVAARGHHTIFRIWLEYPGKTGGVPDFLTKSGVKITNWSGDSSAKERSLTPDYADERLVTALERFIAALGRRYDGDARIGYLTAGLLGSWGEWHTYPREDLFAPRATQRRVLDAYEKAFTKTPVLLRYPAGDNSQKLAPNAARPFGYHDDSFAWGTISASGREDESWFYLALLRAAGPAALEKWRTQPIGGEIRPEAWGSVFDEKPAHLMVQDFAECVRQTHVTWLMDSGMFRQSNPPERQRRAIEQVRRMGYDFFVRTADLTRDGNELLVKLTLLNQGVAPFYRDWPIEVAALNAEGKTIERWPVDWKLTGLLPHDDPREWQTRIAVGAKSRAGQTLALRVVNPLSNGQPLRFANATQDQHAAGWLSLGHIP